MLCNLDHMELFLTLCADFLSHRVPICLLCVVYLSCDATCKTKLPLGRNTILTRVKVVYLPIAAAEVPFAAAAGSFIIIPGASELWNSPSTPCDVAVAALAQAVAVPLPETHWLRGVVTAQQDLQSGEAAEIIDQTHHRGRTQIRAHTVYTAVRSEGWNNCSPSGMITHP